MPTGVGRGNGTTEVRQKPPGANLPAPEPQWPLSAFGAPAHARQFVKNDPSKSLWFKEHHFLHSVSREEAGLCHARNCLLTPLETMSSSGDRTILGLRPFERKARKVAHQVQKIRGPHEGTVPGVAGQAQLEPLRLGVRQQAQALGLSGPCASRHQSRSPDHSQEVRRAFCVLLRTCAVYISPMDFVTLYNFFIQKQLLK